MKISLAISLLILAAATMLGLHDRRSLANLLEHQRALFAQASQRGLLIEPATGAPSPRFKHSKRVETQKNPQLAVATLIATVRDIDSSERQLRELLALMGRLDSGELILFIEEIAKAEDVNHGHRDEMTGLALAMLAEKNPPAALDWITKNFDALPEPIGYQFKCAVISGTVLKNPKLAFQLIDELELGGQQIAWDAMAKGITSNEDRGNLISGLHEYLASTKDSQQQSCRATAAMQMIAGTMSGESFESSAKWLDEAHLSSFETQKLAECLHCFIRTSDTGLWLEWIAKSPSPQTAPISQLMTEWAAEDYKAAGKWLTNTADGPVKTAATSSYARTLAPYQPAAATKWTLTLPEDSERNQLLRLLRGNQQPD